MALPFVSLDDLINNMTNGQYDDFPFSKFSAGAETAGIWHSTWAEPGCPAAGATDSGGTAYVNGGTSGTGGASGASCGAGGFGFSSGINVSPKGRIATALSVSSTQPMSVVLCDRLCAIGPISITSTGSKALTTLPALPRYTNGVGVEVWLEVTTATTTSALVAYLNSYTGTTNGSGTSAGSTRTVTAISATMKVGDMIGPFPLLSPDVGVQGVASFDVSTAPAVGAVNVVLLRRLATMVPIPTAALSNTRNLLSQVPSMPQIYDGATLFLMWQGSTTSPNIIGNLVTAYK